MQLIDWLIDWKWRVPWTVNYLGLTVLAYQEQQARIGVFW